MAPGLPSVTIRLPKTLIFGRGEVRRASGLVAGMGRHVLLVHGRSQKRAVWLIEELRAQGLTVTAIACASEPTLLVLTDALETVRASGADCVAGLGGGAAMDLAKALAALARVQHAPNDYLEIVGSGRALDAPRLPLVLIPTTAGTGAEVTKNAVIGVPVAKRKVSLRDDRMVADVAIVDPALTDGTGREVTLASGLDAITQVIEPYVSSRANAFTDALCRAAIPQGLAALKALMEEDTPAARDRMAWVSLSGGIALGHAGLGVVHAIAGVAGGRSNAPHGALCGALLSASLDANRLAAPAGSEAARRLEEVEGMVAAQFGRDGFAALGRWAREAGLPDLAGLGIASKDHAALADAALSASSMKGNPVLLRSAEVVGILAAS